MVRILSAVAVVLAIAFGAQASYTCQCNFSDGSHCCAATSAQGANVPCATVCKDAHRNSDNVACNAGGKWSSVSAWNVQFRAPCAVQNFQ
ncbi:hypothetical protein GT037_003335 [Alternaria burnsii]|uniref:Extracellular membrane protein CFEM domain-containing protein n=1 Tax=Alternaria burnsii TaxID=1187904 RepID=A0A8H7BAR2_9PLEO|nr:uncharacterized protein GT037_003335 [Alternaria burnsii]KAF7679587.1 hypothetical protein GT037_003335 [Alternaria burnsii]CAI9631302.1 unnamed protein product [Alternaria burnsii]